MKKKKTFFIILVIIIALLLVFLLFPFEKKYSYSEFYNLWKTGKISEVTLKEDSISFVRTDGIKGKTTNPNTPTLKEELLLSNIKVKDDNSSLSSILDILFNVIFLGIILFALYKLIKFQTSTFRVVNHTGVNFSNVAGMNELKSKMLFLVNMMKNEKERESHGIREVRGIILEGPPGNGKTLFARALSEEAGVSFIASKGADFQGALMGLGAYKVKLLFRKARKKKPCIVFIDEFDSIGERRNYAGSGIDKENNRILTTLLNEIDGFTKSEGVLVIAATNSFQSLDPALIRPGRFDLKCTIGNPDKTTRRELISLYTKDKKLSSSLTSERLIDAFDGLSCSAIETILNEAWSIALSKSGEIECDNLREASRTTQIKIHL